MEVEDGAQKFRRLYAEANPEQRAAMVMELLVQVYNEVVRLNDKVDALAKKTGRVLLAS